MNLRDLLSVAHPTLVAGSADQDVRGLTHDSRTAQQGFLFFALPGSRTDGNRHVKDACARGACAVVSELAPPPPPLSFSASWIQVPDVLEAMGRMADLFFSHPSGAFPVFGVTGTSGKTTTSYFLESILRAAGGTPGVLGTVSYRLSGKWETPAVNTTPSSLETLRLLARLRDDGATHAVMEVSSHALALKRVEEIDFDAAVFTNFRSDHLDFHKTAEAYFEAKARLFDLLTKASSTKKRRVAAINADDAKARALLHRAVGAEALLYGLGETASLRALDVQVGADNTRFELSFRGRRTKAEISLVGEHNLYNALAAAAAALGLGLSEEAVLEGLRALKSVPGRLEPVEAGQKFKIFVDYAHTEDALEAVLKHLARLPHKRIITVFGCGGQRDRTKRAPMGRAAQSGSDFTVVTSDNPRGEDPLAIIADIEEGLKTSGAKNYKIQPDRKKAVAEAVAMAREGDIVLIAGKGHETQQILKDRTVAFDDRDAARQAVRNQLNAP
ncbi:MAG: UDP-N-acetylmuramoyl-L-alanyl-D-glutamate--2,6-diaminopimelate ligase [Elusimicrobia bacterium]|nr:UDP-N-acetylmuramoyl-L-alanyl-D-glutamate--2,6-diaminopimelate ligase [Elusimicrobiota bacterium]MDE2313895.1 UDP-N-acetylmuramoyl-L-alanyl-D-glutamate--2,6-diaminopimelate ligase [Elusimicrobiota bacterium]